MDVTTEVREHIRTFLDKNVIPGRLSEAFHIYDDPRPRRGGFGTVYKAMLTSSIRDLKDDQVWSEFAIKAVKLNYETDVTSSRFQPSLSRHSRSITNDSNKTSKFLSTCQEAVFHSASLKHSNLVRCYTSWIEPPDNKKALSASLEELEGVIDRTGSIKSIIRTLKNLKGTTIYMVMDYYEANLKDFVRAQQGSCKVALKKVFRDVMLGLNWMHQNSYIHRDIKPENILIHCDSNGHYKRAAVGDLGLAIAETNMHQQLSRVGTTPYNHYPEHVQGTKIDIWAMGVTMFEICHTNSAQKPDKTTLSRLIDMVNGKESASHKCIKAFIGKHARVMKSLRRTIYVCLMGTVDADAEQVATRLGYKPEIPALPELEREDTIVQEDSSEIVEDDISEETLWPLVLNEEYIPQTIRMLSASQSEADTDD